MHEEPPYGFAAKRPRGDDAHNVLAFCGRGLSWLSLRR